MKRCVFGREKKEDWVRQSVFPRIDGEGGKRKNSGKIIPYVLEHYDGECRMEGKRRFLLMVNSFLHAS